MAEAAPAAEAAASPRPLRELLCETRERILSAPDTVCLERARLVKEAWQRHGDEPVVLRRARAFEHVLAHMTLDVETNPILAGNTSAAPRAWMLIPEHGFAVPGQAAVENPALEGFLDGDAIPRDMRAYWCERSAGGGAGIGHLAIDAERLLARGLTGIVEDLQRQPPPNGPDEAAYLEATVIACEAVMGWATRLADVASAASQEAEGPRRAALARVAAACARVPAQPARSLFEALQSLALVHLAIHLEGHGYSVSPGRLDQLLLPYYRDDEDAVEMVAAFLLVLTANSLWGSHSKTQTITVGGVDGRGRDGCNPLTLAVLEAWEQVQVPDPMVFVRWHESMAAEVKDRAVAMLARGCSMPLLIGDQTTVSGLVAAGVAAADAWNYCVIGCNELGIPGKLIFNAVTLPEADLLRTAVLEARAPSCGGAASDSFEALLDRLQELASERLRSALGQKVEANAVAARRSPTPFTSALMQTTAPGCADLMTGLVYPHVCIRSSGFANLVNGLHALRHLVYERGEVSLEEVAAALEVDFGGCEALQARLRVLRRWGSDDAGPDECAEAWLERRARVVESLRVELDTPPLMMEMVVRSLHHLEGRRLGATPDGRGAGEPLGDSIGPPGGATPDGPTALLNVVRAMDAPRHWPGGYNLNVTLPAVIRSDGARPDGASTRRVRDLAEAYFRGGGQELQLNFLDAGQLREAQEHPERHANLMVRIAGFNAFFVDLSPAQQAEIIARAAKV